MNFSKNFWIGALILASIFFAVWLGCGCFIPDSKYTRIALPILADLITLILFIFIWLKYRKWPWQMNWNEWKEVVEETTSKPEADKEKWR